MEPIDQKLSEKRSQGGALLPPLPSLPDARQLKIPPRRREPAVFGEGGLRFSSEVKMQIALFNARNPVQRLFKRWFDIAASLVAILLLSPLYLALAAWIKWDSPGPVFFKQVRVAKGGRFFTMFKFRSMYVNAADIRKTMNLPRVPGDPRDTKVRNDPRVTRVGRFIRKTSLDELPQLFNVLFGDMSLVGPRPALPTEALEWKIKHFRRLAVEQGCTCIWQVSGRSDTSFQEQMRMDISYVKSWSLFGDLRLILMTIWVMLTGRGAY